jgi:sulfotransferase
MSRAMHFISGLPRSGSTLLSALLNQNPRFNAGVSSGLATLWDAVLPRMSGASEFTIHFDDQRRRAVLLALRDAYYSSVNGDGIIFDTNRAWTGRAALQNNLFPAFRIICCVRNVSWIIDSVERMLAENPMHASAIFNIQPPPRSIYSRVDVLMNPELGFIGLPWSNLRECWFGVNASSMIVVPYEHLVKEPAGVMNQLYLELGEAPFQHRFDQVEFDAPTYDEKIGMPGMHKVKKTVSPNQRDSCLPPEIVGKFADCNFWENPQLNRNRVKIL